MLLLEDHKNKWNRKPQDHVHIRYVKIALHQFFNRVYASLILLVRIKLLPNSLCTVLSLSVTSLLILVL